MKSFMRKSKCDKSTIRKVEQIVTRGYFRKVRSVGPRRKSGIGGAR